MNPSPTPFPHLRRIVALGMLLFLAIATIQSGLADQFVELCFDSLGAGQNVTGNLPGQPSEQLWAGVFNVRVDNVPQQAFCTDINNPISTGQCYQNSSVGATDVLVACTLQYYPPQSGLTNLEASARQTAVWSFSDGFILTAPSDVVNRYNVIRNDILAKNGMGLCDPLAIPALSLDPSEAVNFLAPDGNGGYLDSPHTYTATLTSGVNPLPEATIIVSTNIGTLSADGQTGSSLTLTSDEDGQAVFDITYDQPATANITAQATVALPSGTQIDPGPTVQKIVLNGTQTFVVEDTATKQWVAGSSLVIKKFHDLNRDGIFNGEEQLINWTVKYRPTGGSWSLASLGSDGTLVVGVDPALTYEVCEIENPAWAATTPVCQENVVPPATVWFGNVDLPALLIEKYHDLNGNGQWDEGEPALDGWGFQVLRWQNGGWSLSYSGTTDDGGMLGFANILFPYDYRIEELLLDGWYASTGVAQEITVDQNLLYTVQFGNLQPGSVTINKDWFFNGNPVPPPDTPAVICIKRIGEGTPIIELIPTDGDGNPLTPNADGFYCQEVFDLATWANLWPGTYEVIEYSPDGWTGPGDLPNIIVESGQTGGQTLGYTIENYAGCSSSIGDTVWYDVDGDGVQDQDEPGIAGVTVNLVEAGEDGELGTGDDVIFAPQITDDNGYYNFPDLSPGLYRVDVDENTVPPGFLLTTGNEPMVIILGECEQFTEADFGYAPTLCPRSLVYGVHDAGGYDTQLFTLDLGNGVTAPLGPLYPDHDIEAIEIDPATGIMYNIAGNGGNQNGNLFTVDKETGALALVGNSGLSLAGELVSAAFTPDGTLWAFQEHVGLVTIDLATGAGTVQWNVNGSDLTDNWEGLAWSPDGSVLYGSDQTRLYAWDPATQTASQVCGDDFLPDATEALDFRFDGVMLGGWHNATDGTLSIFEIDMDSCSVQAFEYNVPYNDVESLSSEACVPAGMVNGRVWDDTDLDGVWDANEQPLAGVIVWLQLDQNGDGLPSKITQATTDANGWYQFVNLPAGQYQARLSSSLLGTVAFGLQPGADREVNMGYRPAQHGLFMPVIGR